MRQLRRLDTQAVLATKLPPKRKLKAVKGRINQIMSCGAAKLARMYREPSMALTAR